MNNKSGLIYPESVNVIWSKEAKNQKENSPIKSKIFSSVLAYKL